MPMTISLADRNPQAANRQLQRIDAACDRLVDFPLIGAPGERFGRGFRSWIVGNYVVFYRPSGASIEILRVLHGAREY
jgi:toxin ParE1/3/4